MNYHMRLEEISLKYSDSRREEACVIDRRQNNRSRERINELESDCRELVLLVRDDGETTNTNEDRRLWKVPIKE